jgi:hypothetical protein
MKWRKTMIKVTNLKETDNIKPIMLRAYIAKKITSLMEEYSVDTIDDIGCFLVLDNTEIQMFSVSEMEFVEVLEIGGKTFAPDFTFEGADYKCFYLDYFGMMDNEGYARRNLLKLGDYYNAGLIPGDNLIVAFNLSGILNAGTIKAIIETEIIPRL